ATVVGIVTGFLDQVAIVGGEHIEAREAGGGDGAAVGEPVGDVDVVAALFQHMAAGDGFVPSPSAEDIAAVVEVDGFVEFEGDQLADGALLEQLVYFAVMRRVAQNEAEGADVPGAFDRV